MDGNMYSYCKYKYMYIGMKINNKLFIFVIQINN